MSGFRGTTSPCCEGNMPGNTFDAKSGKKTGKKPALTQKWQKVVMPIVGKNGWKRSNVPVLAAEPRHFLPGRLISIICLSYFRGTAGPKNEISMTRLVPTVVWCRRHVVGYVQASASLRYSSIYESRKIVGFLPFCRKFEGSSVCRNLIGYIFWCRNCAALPGEEAQ